MRRLPLLLVLLGALVLAFPLAALAADGADVPSTNLAAWLALSAVALPWLAAFVFKAHWTASTKSIGVALLAAADAIVVYGFENDWSFDVSTLVVSIAAVFALARVTYSGLWTKIGTGVDAAGPSVIEKVEIATTPGMSDADRAAAEAAASKPS